MNARDLILDALRDTTLIGGQETPKAAMLQRAFRLLNDILEAWTLDGFVAYTATTLDDDIPAYPGYSIALRMTLQEHLAVAYEREVPPSMQRQAAAHRRALRRSMKLVPIAGMPKAVQQLDGCRGVWNPITGTYQ